MTWMERILLALLIVIPWGEGGADPRVLALVHTLIFAAAAALLWNSAKVGRIEALLPWPLLAYLLFVVVGFLGMVRAEYFYGAFDTWWDQAVAALLALALSCAAPSRRFTRLAPFLVVASAVAQAIPAIATRLTTGTAVSISFLNPNHTAAYLNVALFVALERSGWLAATARDGAAAQADARPHVKGERLLFLAAAIVCVSGVVAIASRGALLALAVTITVVIAGTRPASQASPAPGASSSRHAGRLVALALAVIVVALGILSIQMRFSAAVDPYRYDRPRIWMSALRTWADAPLLGLGPGMFEHRSGRHNFPKENAAFRYSKVPGSAHSQPIQTLAEEGLVGFAALAIFAAALGAVVIRSRRAGGAGAAATRESARALVPALLVTGIHSLFEMIFQAPAIPLTLLVLSWPALRPEGVAGSAASFVLPWPSGASEARSRRSTAIAVATAGGVLFLVAVAAPFGSWLASEYATAGNLPPVRIDLAFRSAESMNPLQPYIGYGRARAALARSRSISPPLLANAMDSLEKTIRIEPGDPSAYALLGGLYARAANDLPGAGPGALAAAERRLSQAIERAPCDAALLVERASFRLSRGLNDRALEDAEAALLLEPNALAAHQLRLEAHLASGRRDRASAALLDLDAATRRLGDHVPLNGYEGALMRLDSRRLDEVREKIGG